MQRHEGERCKERDIKGEREKERHERERDTVIQRHEGRETHIKSNMHTNIQIHTLVYRHT